MRQEEKEIFSVDSLSELKSYSQATNTLQLSTLVAPRAADHHQPYTSPES